MNEWGIQKRLTRSLRDRVQPAVWLASAAGQDTPESRVSPEGPLWPVDPPAYARSRMVAAIDAAAEVVCVASFLFSDPSLREALLRAAGRGVRCYMLTMSEQHLLKDLERESEFAQRQVAEHTATLDALAGHVLVRTARHLHTKFLVVDPGDNGRMTGFVSTANLTPEALTRNVELVLQVRGEVARALFDQFRLGFWGESEHELLEPGRLETVGEAGRRTIPPPHIPRLAITATGIQGLKAELLDLVRWAGDELWLSTYNLSLEHEVTQALLARVREGLKVRVFARMRPPNMAAVTELAKAGAEVYGHPFVHAKAVLARSAGQSRGLLMTANVEARGLDEGFETGVVLDGPEQRTLRSILEAWETTFHPLRVDVPRGDLEGSGVVWDGRDLHEARVGGSVEIDLGEIEAKSITAMEDEPPPALPEPAPSEPLTLPHEVVYRWTVVPPSLPKGAHRVHKDRSLPVFEYHGNRYVAVPSRDRLEEALHLGDELGARVVVEQKGAKA